ncbi:hypothetical protein F783_009700 [Bordetella holmesii F627]|nr:hypothetical protein F783_009700 [Bordetella holmesii F627]
MEGVVGQLGQRVAQHDVPHGFDLLVEPRQHIFERLVAGVSHRNQIELPQRVGIAAQILRGMHAGHLAVTGPQLLQQFSRNQAIELADAVARQFRPQGAQLLDFDLGVAPHPDPPALHMGDHAGELQQAQGLAYRAAASAETLLQVLFAQGLARRERAVDNQLPDLLLEKIRNRGRRLYRRAEIRRHEKMLQ